MSTDAVRAVADLVALLDVEAGGDDRFCGARHPGGKGRVFGGQVIAQALAAATRTVTDNRPAHSLHAYFMRPGDEAQPIFYQVMRDFDGGSFATRRVIASQDGNPILNLTASFQRAETGFEHAAPPPDVPPPEALAGGAAGTFLPPALAHFMARFGAVEMRPVDPAAWLSDTPSAAVKHVWLRLAAPIEANAALQRVLLAYVSDFGLLTTTTLPHGVRWFSGALQVASLDHALWFHDAPRLDQWLLYTMDSPWAGSGRGLARGALYTAEGKRVASVTQEGLIRRARR